MKDPADSSVPPCKGCGSTNPVAITQATDLEMSNKQAT